MQTTQNPDPKLDKLLRSVEKRIPKLKALLSEIHLKPVSEQRDIIDEINTAMIGKLAKISQMLEQNPTENVLASRLTQAASEIRKCIYSSSMLSYLKASLKKALESSIIEAPTPAVEGPPKSL